jgi:lactate dehydrogenase-like 2-hydroxyacid dehydrogenase
MELAYHSRRPADGDDFRALYLDTLDALLASSDVVSLHCPGGPDTHHLIDARRLSIMKPSAILINTARGSVVDEAALADALAGGTIASAGLDVYEREPRVHPELSGLANVVLLPHLGSATVETRTAMGNAVMFNLDHFFAGQPLPNRIA